MKVGNKKKKGGETIEKSPNCFFVNRCGRDFFRLRCRSVLWLWRGGAGDADGLYTASGSICAAPAGRNSAMPMPAVWLPMDVARHWRAGLWDASLRVLGSVSVPISNLALAERGRQEAVHIDVAAFFLCPQAIFRETSVRILKWAKTGIFSKVLTKIVFGCRIDPRKLSTLFKIRLAGRRDR